MQQEEGIIIFLAIALLSICYLSPLTSEGFSNNPQGSIGTLINSFNPGPSVRQWKTDTGDMLGPGPERSYNMGTMSSFPFMEQSKISNNEVIQLVKPDGVILGGYLPQILRPFDTVTAQSPGQKSCNFPCYSDIKHNKWCNEDNAINYYGMRPLISPKNYNKMLQKLFNVIIDRNAPMSMNPSDDK